MFASFMPSTASQTTLIASACFAVLAGVCVSYQRLQAQNRRLSTAINNMSQGLNMFDAQGALHLAEPALRRNVQAFAGDCETGLLAQAPDRVSQRNGIVRRRSGQLREEHSRCDGAGEKQGTLREGKRRPHRACQE